MENLIAIGVGLGLRAFLDAVTHHNHRIDGSLVGLWEGAVLRHFISKYPSSLDPFIAYSVRLLVDLLWTSNWMRLFVVVIWTFMGMLLSDVGLDLASDRRFRTLLRGVRHTIIYPILGRSSSQSRSATTTSRVQFFQIPATTTTTSTARSPVVRSPPSPLPTDTAADVHHGVGTPAIPRRPALRVPGSFPDRWSETDTDAGRAPSVGSLPEGSVTSRTSSSRTPSVTFSDPLVISRQPSRYPSRAPPIPVPPTDYVGPLPTSPHSESPVPFTVPPPATYAHASPPGSRTPSELEYVAIPAIPDNIEQINPVRMVPSDDERSVGSSIRGHSDGSRLTTPTSDRHRPHIDVQSPEPVNSGLTTPERPSTPLHGLPPVRVLEEGIHTPSVATAELSDATPIPIPLRLYGRSTTDDDAEQFKASLLHPELLPDINTPHPSPGFVPPAQYLPRPEDEKRPIMMPVPSVPQASDIGTGRMSTMDPPPAYEPTPGEDEDDNTPADSVITNADDRTLLVQRAESLRKSADDADKRRGQLKQELQEARRNRDHWAAFRLKHEIDRAEKETREFNAKAARRFYHAHNLKRTPQTIDVHRLKVSEAIEQVEQALYEAIVTNTPELRIITGRGNHSKNGIPAIKLAVIGTMADHHIDAITDPKNPGVLVIHPPTNPSIGAGPSTSS